MPVTKLQSGILRLLAAHRDPESYDGSSTPLNRNAPRYSGDIDFFHDREGLINEIRRIARYTEADFRRVASDPPVDPAATMTRFRKALDEAEAFVVRMPTDKIGLLFLKDGKVVQPDPERLDEYTTHAGQRRGHWPSSLEISTAMFEHYKNKACDS